MSFERFSSSDVYIFEHANGFIECCGCLLDMPEDEESWIFPQLETPRKAIEHLKEHQLAGHNVGKSIKSITDRYADLDSNIEPYVPDPKQKERFLAKLKELYKEDQ